MFHRAFIASIVGILGTAALPALADAININYDITHVGGYTSEVGTPVYGWPYPHANMGTAVVTANSAVLKTDSSNAEVGALLLDTSVNSQASLVTLNFDINVLAQAATGYGQTKTDNGTPKPILFGMRIFANSIPAASFQLAPTSATTGLFGFRDSDNLGLTTFGTYNTNEIHHVQIDVNYATGVADAYIDNNLAISNYALWGGSNANPTTSEIFAYLNGTTTGVSNEVAFGDLQPAAAPLPGVASMGLTCLALVGARRLSRRKPAH